MATTVRCRATYEVEGIRLNNGESYSIGPLGDRAFRIWLSNVESEGNWSNELEVSGEFSLNDARQQIFDSLENGKLPQGSKPDRKDERINPDGSFDPNVVLKLDYLPYTFENLFHEVGNVLHENGTKMLRLLRWRYQKRISFRLQRTRGLWWESKARGRWIRFPSYLPQPGPVSLEAWMSHHDHVAQFITEQLAANADEPLGHRLMQDAFDLTRRDPRAAMILSVAAFEVGVKEFIARCVPEAEWLAFNAPTPPVEQIVLNYLPQLCPNLQRADLEAVFSKDRIAALRKYVGLRNKVTHTGSEVTHEQAVKACESLSELLFCLDFARGQAWAKPT